MTGCDDERLFVTLTANTGGAAAKAPGRAARPNDFGRRMRELVTSPGVVAEEIERIKAGILALAESAVFMPPGAVSRRRTLADVYGEFAPAPPRVPESERRTHRCDESCDCPADGKPMFYAPSTGQHACQDPDCGYAHPDGD